VPVITFILIGRKGIGGHLPYPISAVLDCVGRCFVTIRIYACFALHDWEYSAAFWHASVYNSAWIAVFLFSSALIASCGYFVGIVAVLELSIVVEIARRLVGCLLNPDRPFFAGPATAKRLFPIILCHLPLTGIFLKLIFSILQYVTPVMSIERGLCVAVKQLLLVDGICTGVCFLTSVSSPGTLSREVLWAIDLPPELPNSTTAHDIQHLFEPVDRSSVPLGALCPINCSPIEFPIRLRCGHIFERNAIVERIRIEVLQSRNCSMCRRPMTGGVMRA